MEFKRQGQILLPLKFTQMNSTDRPKCAGKCATCFYSQINGCIALAGDDFYLNFSGSELKEIANHAYNKALQNKLKFISTTPVEKIIA